MKSACLTVLLLAGFVLPAMAGDRDKVEKQIRMMTAMSRDQTARAVVSHTFSEVFKIPRSQLVHERQSLNLNYGSLFLEQELLSSGARLEEIASQLAAHKTVLEIADTSHADWSRIVSDAKKMNSRIKDGIYQHFLHSKPDQDRDNAEPYNASTDLVRADLDTTRDDLIEAQRDYVFWRNLAAPPKTPGQADRNSVIGKAYEQTRQDVEDTHGNTAATSVNH